MVMMSQDKQTLKQTESHKLKDYFRRFSVATANAVGTPGAFILAFVIICVWGATGPLFGFTDTWQLIINTGTTIITFLMVFLIQYSQNRDSKAIQLKLDELIRSSRLARNDLVDLEEMTDEELEKLQNEFKLMRAEACTKLAERKEKRPHERS
jgi:low affinity Fe/Cu permease